MSTAPHSLTISFLFQKLDFFKESFPKKFLVLPYYSTWVGIDNTGERGLCKEIADCLKKGERKNLKKTKEVILGSPHEREKFRKKKEEVREGKKSI